MACYLASVAPHSGDWLLALPRARWIAAQGRHAMVCKKASGRVARHQVLNDIILRAINAADVPAVKEPSGLNRQDGKRPDGLSLIP